MRLFLTFVFLSTASFALDFFSNDRLDELFDGGKIHDFIDGLKNVTDKTKNSLKLATGLHSKHGKSKEFKQFFQHIAQFNKEYDDDATVQTRFSRFSDSMKQVDVLKKQNPLAEFGPTKFSDLSREEFIIKHTGIKNISQIEEIHAEATKAPLRSKRSTPTVKDWRAQYGVTSVKDQKSCGCCYAFAALAAIESQYIIKTSMVLDLSEQQAVSCTYNNSAYDNNQGCNGGTSPGVLRYAIREGLTSESNWPYTSGDDNVVPACQSKPTVINAVSQQRLPSGDEDNMATVVAESGPIVTYIDPGPLQNYVSGILDVSPPSNGWQISHAVLTIGYGIHSNVTFWIIKNSWSAQWGEKGYFRVRRGTNCLDLAQHNFAVSI